MKKHKKDHEKKRGDSLAIVVTSVFFLAFYAITFFLYSFLASHMGARQYADISIILKALVLLPPIILLGSSLLIVRFFPEYLRRKMFSTLTYFLRFNFKIFAISSIVCFLVGILWGVAHILIDRYTAYTFSQHYIYVYAIWLIPLFAAPLLMLKCLQALKRFILYVFFNQVFFWLILLITVLIYGLFIQTHISSFAAVNMIAISVVISFSCVFPIFIKLVWPYLWRKVARVKKVSWWRSGIKYLLATISYASINLIDMVMVRVLASSPRGIDAFIAIFQIASIFFIISTIFSAIITPYLSEDQSKHGLKSLSRKLDVFNFLKLSISLLPLALIIIFAKDILYYFNPSFVSDAGVASLIIVAVAAFISSVLDMPALFLLMRERQNWIIAINFMSFIAIIVLDIFIVPAFGILGAAIVFLGVILLESFLCLLISRVLFKQRSFFCF